MVHSLVIDGIFAGVGSVLSFLPIIVTLFFFLSILEDTGYMARVAFVMDKLLRKIGLSGRSIRAHAHRLRLLRARHHGDPHRVLGPGPEDDHSADALYELLGQDSHLCASLPPRFSPSTSALVMIALYVLGILVGILAALVLKSTAFRGKPVPFVMELPNYRLPSAKSVGLLLWEKAKDFLQRAFTVIFLATVVIWFLQTFDTRLNVVTDSADSLLALIGQLAGAAVQAAGLWRLALRHGADLRLYRQGVGGQHAAGAAGERGHHVAVHHAQRHQLSGVHAAVYTLHCGGGHHTA